MSVQIKDYHRLCLAVLAPVFFILLPFLHVFANNATDLQLPLAWFGKEVLSLSVITAIGLYGLLKILPRAIERPLAVFVIFLILAAWLQINFFIGEFGFLDGGELDWYRDQAVHVLQMIIMVALLIGLFAFTDKVLENLLFLALLLILSSSVYLPQLLEKTEATGTKRYTFTQEGLFDFSSSKNVIIFVLDSLQADVANEILSRNRSLAAQYRGFTLFRNSVSPFPKTYASIPALLSGRPYDNSQPLRTYLNDVYLLESLSAQLQREGFDARYASSSPHSLLAHPLVADNVVDAEGGYEGAEQIVRRDRDLVTSMVVFRLIPNLLKPAVYFDGHILIESTPPAENVTGVDGAICRLPDSKRRYSKTRRSFDNRLIDEFLACASASVEAPVFRFFHLYAPHAPYQLNQDFAYVGPKPPQRESLIPQTEGTLVVVGEMLERLREIDVMDRSLILIVSDHGEGEYNVGINYDQALPVPPNNPPGADQKRVRGGIPLIMGNLSQGEGNLAVSDAPVELTDIPATVYQWLGLANTTSGRSIFSVGEDESRTRLHRHYKFSGWNVDYILPMTEYKVDGFSWYPESWSPTGRNFSEIATRNFNGRLVTFQEGGNLDQFDPRGWHSATALGRTIEGNSGSLNIEPQTKSDGILTLIHGFQLDQDEVIDILIDEVVVDTWEFYANDNQVRKTSVIPQDLVARMANSPLGFRRPGRDPSRVLFKEIRFHAANQYNYTPGTQVNFTTLGNSSDYRTYGWSRTENWGTSSVGRKSGALLKLADPGQNKFRLKLKFSGYVFDAWPEQKVELHINDRKIHTFTVRDRVKRSYELDLPEDIAADNGLLDIEFRYLTPVRQSDIGVGGDYRLQAIAMISLSVDRAP